MNKELNYLSLPDYFNKFLLTNFSQKINLKKNIGLQFKLDNNNHLGSALKAIYLLEIIFPKKAFVFKIILKTKKLYFGQKSKNTVFFTFNLSFNILQFTEFYRFFSIKPLSLKKTKLEEIVVITKKLKQFDFNNKMFLSLNSIDSSFFFLNFYHLN